MQGRGAPVVGLGPASVKTPSEAQAPIKPATWARAFRSSHVLLPYQWRLEAFPEPPETAAWPRSSGSEAGGV